MTTLDEARAITRASLPLHATLADDVYYDNATYWLIPMDQDPLEVEADSPVPAVRKEDGVVEWLLPHLPPVTTMEEHEVTR